MIRRLWQAVPLLGIIITAAWLAYAVWAFATIAPQAPPEPTPVSEPYRRLVAGCEEQLVLVSPCARSLAAGKSYGFTWFRYEDCERGTVRGILPIKCEPFWDEEPFIQFEEQSGGEGEMQCH